MLTTWLNPIGLTWEPCFLTKIVIDMLGFYFTLNSTRRPTTTQISQMLAVAALIVAKNGIDYLLPWHRLFKTRFGNWLLEKIGAFKITLQYNIKCSSQRLGFCPLETMLDSKEVSVTCVFVEMINFTEYVSSHHSSKESQLFMQDYVDLIAGTAEKHGSIIDEVLGDGILCHWEGVATENRDKACVYALAMQKMAESLTYKIRIGIYSGISRIGFTGCGSVIKFGCYGEVIIKASRIESLCALLQEPILYGAHCLNFHDTVDESQFVLAPRGEYLLKGFLEKVYISKVS